ncbi:MAG: MBL fold metallo-hydrolase [Bacteroidales bacterium]|nr:MBL fold metallo-hydrolase [Candidatus Physcocola equi]
MMLKNILTGNFFYQYVALVGEEAARVLVSSSEDNAEVYEMALRTFVFEGDGKLVLFDTGIGTKHQQTMEELGFHNLKSLNDCLVNAGYKPENVTDIVLSSIHFEHCGGTTLFAEDQSVQLAFPNATVHIAERQWTSMINPEPLEECMFIPSDVMETFKQDKLHVLKDDEKLCASVELRLVDGHTKGLIVPVIHSDKELFMLVGDAVPTSVNLNLNYLDVHDLNPQLALQVKEQLLNEAVDRNMWVVFPHDAETVAAKIKKNADGVYTVFEVRSL